MKYIVALLAVWTSCAGHPLDFTYKGIEYAYQIPPQKDIDASPVWRFEMGEPPVSPTQAYSLAWDWVKKNFGDDFEGTVHTVSLSWQGGVTDVDGVKHDHAWWSVIVTEKKESAKKAAEFFAAKKGDTYTGPNLYVYVFFNRHVVGPKKKEANQAPEPTPTAVTPPAAQEPRQP
jgi:hypothetical protein